MHISNMGNYVEGPDFKTIVTKPLHPTFAAEVESVDFENLSDEQFSEILAAMAKVRPHASPRSLIPSVWSRY